jgi:Ca-activated chloride channel family protein
VGNEVNRPLLDQLATETGGLAAFISANDNFEQQAEAFRRKLTRPAATNLQVKFEGAEVYDLEPQTLPSLFYGQPVRLFGRYKGHGPVKLQLSAEVLGSPLVQTTEVTLPDQEAGNPEIERMWAWRRVNRLMAEGRRDGSQANVGEIVRLCEGFSIANEHASFIVLENDAEYQRWKVDRRNATRIGRDRAAQTAVRERLEELRRQTAAKIGPRPAEAIATAAGPQAPSDLARQDATSSATRPATDFSPSTSVAPAPRGGGGGGGGGGGAIDPVTVLVAGGLAGLGWACRKRKEKK